MPAEALAGCILAEVLVDSMLLLEAFMGAVAAMPAAEAGTGAVAGIGKIAGRYNESASPFENAYPGWREGTPPTVINQNSCVL